MKTLILSLFFIGVSSVVYAQSFGIINDKNGFVNVRKDSTVHSSIVGKIYKDFVFGYDSENKTHWIKIYKQGESNHFGIEGYVYFDRILPLIHFRSIKSVRRAKNQCAAINDSLTIIIESKLFNPKKHKLQYYNSTQLVKIDGNKIWGTDGNLPKSVISSVKVIKKGTKILIPTSAFHNFFEPNLNTLKVYLGNNTIYIEMDNSDGAGSYSIIWTIKNNKYFARYIDNSNA